MTGAPNEIAAMPSAATQTVQEPRVSIVAGRGPPMRQAWIQSCH